MSDPKFEVIGYSKDYYLNGKYMFSVKNKKADRKIYGYNGRKTEVLQEDIRSKRKIIKKGETVVTELFPLNGKLLK